MIWKQSDGKTAPQSMVDIAEAAVKEAFDVKCKSLSAL